MEKIRKASKQKQVKARLVILFKIEQACYYGGVNLSPGFCTLTAYRNLHLNRQPVLSKNTVNSVKSVKIPKTCKQNESFAPEMGSCTIKKQCKSCK